MSLGHDQSSDGSAASAASARPSSAEPATSSPTTSLSSLPHVTLAEGGAAAASGDGSAGGGGSAVWIPPPPDHAASAGGGAVAEARDELRCAHADLEAGRLEAKRLKADLELLRRKQRELKRGQTRDDVVLQLEVRLELKSNPKPDPDPDPDPNPNPDPNPDPDPDPNPHQVVLQPRKKVKPLTQGSRSAIKMGSDFFSDM